jgi:hypothetical protein
LGNKVDELFVQPMPDVRLQGSQFSSHWPAWGREDKLNAEIPKQLYCE